MHQITIDDIIPALNREIDLASSVDARTSKKKKITFNPESLKYKVTFSDSKESKQHQYTDPLIAIEKFNQYYV